MFLKSKRIAEKLLPHPISWFLQIMTHAIIFAPLRHKMAGNSFTQHIKKWKQHNLSAQSAEYLQCILGYIYIYKAQRESIIYGIYYFFLQNLVVPGPPLNPQK